MTPMHYFKGLAATAARVIRGTALPEFDFEGDASTDQRRNNDDPPPIKWTQQRIVMLLLSGLVGSALGTVVALAVISALAEIVVSSTFSLYFGTIFLVIGCVVIWRTLTQGNYPPDEQQRARLPRLYLLGFGCLNAVTGLICCVVSHEALLTMPLMARLLAFSLLGMSSAFALTFGIIDLVNLAVGFCRPNAARPLVESIFQIYIVIGTALAMGALFGILFAVAPIDRKQPLSSFTDDEPLTRGGSMVFLAHMVNPIVSIPIGVIVGGIVGIVTEYSRRVEAAFYKLDDPIQFEYDI